MSSPLDALGDDGPVAPRPEFAAALRRRIEVLLAAPADPPDRTAPEPEPRSPAMTTNALVPYLAVHDAAAAIAWYADALGAIESFRVPMGDGRVGHAELRIGAAVLYLADEYPEIGHVSPRTLGGASSSMHLTVTDVDSVYARAVDAGATALREPADQPHGMRQAGVVDPFGHRWILSQPLGAPPPRAARGGIWAALNYADAPAGIRFLVDVFGFETDLVVPGATDGVVEHSQLRWPEGGVVQAATAHRGNVFSERPTGTESLYVITADPMAVWARCTAAGVEVVAAPSSPDYDPDGLVFSVRDPEGNLWSFGTYGGETPDG